MKKKPSGRPKLDEATKANYQKSRSEYNSKIQLKVMLKKRAKLAKRFDAKKPVPKKAAKRIKTDRAAYLEGK